MTESDLNSTKQWFQVLGPTLASTDYSTPTNMSYLVIEANKLLEGNTYRFALQVETTGGISTASIEFSVNTGPRYGTFTTQPTTGNELTTIFTLTANGWEDFEDTDYPLLYGYEYLDSQ